MDILVQVVGQVYAQVRMAGGGEKDTGINPFVYNRLFFAQCEVELARGLLIRGEDTGHGFPP